MVAVFLLQTTGKFRASLLSTQATQLRGSILKPGWGAVDFIAGGFIPLYLKINTIQEGREGDVSGRNSGGGGGGGSRFGSRPNFLTRQRKQRPFIYRVPVEKGERRRKRKSFGIIQLQDDTSGAWESPIVLPFFYSSLIFSHFVGRTTLSVRLRRSKFPSGFICLFVPVECEHFPHRCIDFYFGFKAKSISHCCLVSNAEPQCVRNHALVAV